MRWKQESRPKAWENKVSITILCAVRNRTENLRRALESWEAVPGILRYVIVDWGSETPVEEELSVASKPSLHLVRAESADWHMSAALNAGLAEIGSGWILKVDADHILQQSFLASNPPIEGTFLRGFWADFSFRDSGLNGLCLVQADDLKLVGGWDERISTYGHEDTDLYERLQSQGLTQRFIARGSAEHLRHPSHAQLARGQISTVQSTMLNRALAMARPPWPVDSTNSPRVGPLLDSNSLDALFLERSHYRFRLARIALLQGLKLRLGRVFYRLSEKLLSLLTGSGEMKTLVVVPAHGLGNRLRALTSAIDMCATRGWALKVIWLRDDHLDCDLTRLISYRGHLDTRQESVWKLVNERGVRFRNLVGNRPKLAGVVFPWLIQKMVVRSSRTLHYRRGNADRRSRIMRSWIFNEEVETLSIPIEAAPDVGVHIRTGGELYAAGATFGKRTNNWSESDASTIAAKRANTKPKNFRAAMKQLGLDGAVATGKSLLVCSDSQAAAEEFGSWAEKRGWSVSYGHNVPSRDSDSVVCAMADMISLSRCGYFLGSTYSAFSDVVLMLRGSGESKLV